MDKFAAFCRLFGLFSDYGLRGGLSHYRKYSNRKSSGTGSGRVYGSDYHRKGKRGIWENETQKG
jgi:hypothetical protein